MRRRASSSPRRQATDAAMRRLRRAAPAAPAAGQPASWPGDAPGAAPRRRAIAAVVLAAPALAARSLQPAARRHRRDGRPGRVRSSSKEAITETGFFHGMYRDIPLKRESRSTGSRSARTGRRYTRGGSTALGSIDTPGTFNFESTAAGSGSCGTSRRPARRGRSRCRTGFAGSRQAYDDVVDVNLRVWGDQWDAQLDDLTASLRLPHPVAFGPSYRVWGHPPWVNGVVHEHRVARRCARCTCPPTSGSSCARSSRGRC